MPFLTKRVETQDVPVWDKPKRNLRFVAVKPTHAVYVIEEEPGCKPIKTSWGNHKVIMPWRYFFIKITNALQVPGDAGAYVFFSNRRAAHLKDPVLKIPYLPNMWKEGGICPAHIMYYHKDTPMETAQYFIDWFYDSKGAYCFDPHPPEGEEMIGEQQFYEKWAKMSQVRVLKIKWKKATHASIRDAIKNLGFDYWERRTPYRKPHNLEVARDAVLKGREKGNEDAVTEKIIKGQL